MTNGSMMAIRAFGLRDSTNVHASKDDLASSRPARVATESVGSLD
jgi:hypothetical protein